MLAGSLLGRILPAEVVGAELRGEGPCPELFPEEAAQVANAVAKRRMDYASARHCARKALAELGIGPVPILSGSRREPLWPDGVVGSMTHTAGYRAAAVARADRVVTVGIDAEPDGPLPDDVLPAVTLEDERAHLAELAAARPDVHWDKLLFSAKESVYKAWYPLARVFLDFEQARLRFDPERGEFTAELLVPGPAVAGRRLTGFTGRWLVADGLVITAIALPG